MSNKKFIIRRMDRGDIDLAIDWATKEVWNPGIHDGDCFYYTDPHGFIGLYMVKPEYRGKGFGVKLWKTAMKYMENRKIGLDGVIAQQENYKKFGFQPAYRNIRNV